MCVLKVVLIFRNILPCNPYPLPPTPPPLKSIFLDSLTMVFLLLSIFLSNFFLLAFCKQRIQYMFKIVLFFIFTNLVQIEEKTNTPVTVFLIMFLMKTYICIGFRNGMFSWYTVFMADTKIKEHISLSLEKKNFCLCNFEESLSCCLHDQSHWPNDLPTCQPAQVRSCGSH